MKIHLKRNMATERKVVAILMLAGIAVYYIVEFIAEVMP